MTQIIQNYQETVNTLQFGQKAKNVKTTVNINEIEKKSSNPEALEKAKRRITELEEKIKGIEKNNKSCD